MTLNRSISIQIDTYSANNINTFFNQLNIIFCLQGDFISGLQASTIEANKWHTLL